MPDHCRRRRRSPAHHGRRAAGLRTRPCLAHDDGQHGRQERARRDPVPTAPDGTINYNRQVRTSKAVARAIRQGKGVYLLHGVDYNGNGTYDFKGNGKSDLDPTLPAEATDPAACTVLHVQR